MTVTVNISRKAVEVQWDTDNHTGLVELRAEHDGDVSTRTGLVNDGYATLTYPADFHGTSHIQVIEEDGTVLDEGDINV